MDKRIFFQMKELYKPQQLYQKGKSGNKWKKKFLTLGVNPTKPI